MKYSKGIFYFLSFLVLTSVAGNALNMVLPNAKADAYGTAPSLENSPKSTASSSEQNQLESQNLDTPVDTPTVYPAGTSIEAELVCEAAIKQFVSYAEARAAYLIRAGNAAGNSKEGSDTATFLASREQAVIGELATMAAMSGTFQGNPDHFNRLTTLSAERLAVELAKHWHTTDTPHRQEVTTYDVHLGC